MNTKIIAVFVAIVAVGGIATAFVVFDGDDGQQKKGGWYSWEPQTFLMASSNAVPSPHWVKTIGDIYEGLYGELPDFSEYSIEDVPDDYLSYNSLVRYNADGDLVVSSQYLVTGGTWASEDVVIKETPTGMISSGSYMMVLYYAMCIAEDKDPMAYDPEMVAKMWSMAHAGDQSLYGGMQTNYGMPAGFTGTQLPNPTFVMDNQEVTIQCVDDLVEQGKRPIWIAGGSLPAYNSGGSFMKGVMEEAGCYSVTFNIGTFSAALGSIEAIAHIFGYGDVADKIIDTLRVQMYTLDKGAEKEVEERGGKFTVLGTYTNSDWTNNDSSTQGMMFGILHLDNVYKLPASGNWDGENVIAAQPDVIVFLLSDPTQVDWNQAMRVPAATS